MPITYDLSGLQKLLADLRDLQRKFKTGFREEVVEWGDMILESWHDQWPRPDWAPLEKSTLQRKRRGGWPDTPLVREGVLIFAATHRGAPGNIFEVTEKPGGIASIKLGVSGDMVPYAEAQHDFIGGGRPWDEITDEDMELLGELITKTIRESTGG
jgi:hypothetical protein